MAYLKNITQSGVSFAQLPTEKRSIIFTNYLAIILTSATWLLLLLRIVLFQKWPDIYIITVILLFILPVLFNHWGYIYFSRLYLCWLPPLAILVVHILLMKQQSVVSDAEYDGLRIFLLGLSCLPYLLMNLSHKKVFFISLLLPFLIIVWCDPILELLKVGHSFKGAGDKYAFNAMRTIVAYVILSGSCFSLKWLVEKGDQQNAALIKELHLKQAETEKARKEAEEARQEAEEANRSKSVFLATMSHEIRTPMNGVIGMASLLAETNQSKEQHEYTETIRSCGESLLTVISDILDFSKIESGKMELDQHDFDLRTCIEEVLDLFASKAAQIGVDLIYQIDYNVPSKVIGDGQRLRQVLVNLVGNAIKFTKEGEIFVDVHLQKTLADNTLQLGFDVRDTGIGIAADKLDRLFKAFSQVDSSTTRQYGGTGLGLAISEKLIALMGGSIEVESTPGQGTTFRFSIQIQTSTEALRAYVYNNTIGLEGKRILVVDDNATNRLILQNQLEQWQMIPIMANSGAQALALFDQQLSFDLVITDMQMPEMDGIDLATIIRQKHPKLPIILLSSMGIERRQLHPDMFCSILTKPVKQQVLFNHISSQLKHQGKVEEETTGKHILSEAFASQHPFQILLAEDNLVNQKLIIRVLNKLGYQPDLALNGLQVIAALERKKYTLVLMDVQMPEMNGLEATLAIRQQFAVQPFIIAMTANAMQGDREECLKAGMDDYLSKPIKLDELLQMLEKWSIHSIKVPKAGLRLAKNKQAKVKQ
ncbi:MAG: response regulator [Bacteroidota bacterium]